ncbi:MAG: DUF2200 domain-containing protein [Rikenellaceae bacterium]
MSGHNIYTFKFNEMYKLYTAKIERKGRLSAELDEVVCWLTGYTSEDLHNMNADCDMTSFFENAPTLNPNRDLIKGSICGVKLAEIEEPLMKEIRYLDKLVDELAKGKAMDKILRK